MKGRILPVLGLVAGLVLTFFGVRAMERAFRSSHWPTAPGTVISSSVEATRSRRSVTYRPHVEYRYTVDGHEHSSDTLTFAGLSGGLETAQAWVRRYPRGSSVTVHYAPDDPDLACLSPDAPGWRDYLVNAIGLALTAIGGLTLYEEFRRRSRAKAKAPRGERAPSPSA